MFSTFAPWRCLTDIKTRTRLGFSFGIIIIVMTSLVSHKVQAGIFDNAHYELGRGLTIPSLNLTFSGYSNLRLRNLENSGSRLQLHDLSLFTSWKPSLRWRFFAEIEAEDVFTVGDGGFDMSDTEIVVERLYADYLWKRSINIRVGRFLTPFGRWNLIHADPLVWTVTRPLVTTLAIPDHGTGIVVFGNIPVRESRFEYYLYVDNSEDLDLDNADTPLEGIDLSGVPNDFLQAAGAKAVYHFFNDRAQIGASYASIRLDGDSRLRHVLGVNGFLSWNGIELSTETAYRFLHDGGGREEWGTFVQGVAPVYGALNAFLRLEFYSSKKTGVDASRINIGLAYRPVPATTFKLEYNNGSDHRLAPDGWQASWAVLF